VQNETKEKVKIASQSFITELIKPAIVFKETENDNNIQVIGFPDLASFIQMSSDSCCWT